MIVVDCVGSGIGDRPRSWRAAAGERGDARPLAPLSAAVEVAAYRIATEALNNVSRHSMASAATVRLRTDDSWLTLTVQDNGDHSGAGWQPGVGLASMRERAAELGGSCAVGPGPAGGQVVVTIPLGAPR